MSKKAAIYMQAKDDNSSSSSKKYDESLKAQARTDMLASEKEEEGKAYRNSR